jgi:hypothetical protein
VEVEFIHLGKTLMSSKRGAWPVELVFPWWGKKKYLPKEERNLGT